MRAGLFIGTSKYLDARIKALDFACEDALRLLRQLTRTSGFTTDNSVVCISDNVTADGKDEGKDARKETILTQLALFEGARTELEAFVFFFSGHGFRSQQGIDYLVPQNATLAALPDTSIALADIIRRCCNVNAHNIIIIIDACRDQFAYTSSFEPIAPSVTGTALTNKNTSILFSADANTRSYEDGSLKGGIYTSCLCDSLEIEYECRKLHELQDFLSQHVPNVCERVGKPKQAPWAAFLGDQTRDFILPVSKLHEKLDLPPSVGRETGRSHKLSYYQDYEQPIVIDFGTTKSILAYGTPSGYSFAKDSRGRVCVPSTVKFLDNGNYEIGADPFSGVNSRYSKRRLLTQVFGDTKDEMGLNAEHYAMLVIGSLVRNFEDEVKKKARRCVLTIPTDYNIVDISRIVNCVQAAGIRVERIVPEPTAAAFNVLPTLREALRANRSSDRWVVVVDMGGGTLDVALVFARAEVFGDHPDRLSDFHELDDHDAVDDDLDWPIGNLTFSILASSGDARLGGIDFNALLKDYFVRKLKDVHKSGETIVFYLEHELEAEIERAKIALSVDKLASIHLQDVAFSDGASKQISLKLKRKEFDDLSLALFVRYGKCIDDCISFGSYHDDISLHEDASLDAEDDASDPEKTYRTRVDSVIVAGQSGQIHRFKADLRKKFPRACLIDEHSDTAVARGLAEWLYTGVELEIDDIAHTYIGVAGVVSEGNRLIVTDQVENEHPALDPYTLIYPTDRIPAHVEKMISWPAAARVATVTITTNTIGKPATPVCRIPIENELFMGGEGFLRVSVDEMLTVVVEIRDLKENRRCWQINNFFRMPSGYIPVGNIGSAALGLRLLNRS
ncbi:molecular chaperone DnaK (HSP70) [Bradyrhizobium sp. GM2.2]|uniref:Hsp70 family protein n=1 Tax=Bradyrhizobium sp. GM2.2 TaxID=3156358 RepID=UPI0033936DFE